MDDILKRLEARDIAAWDDAYSCRARGAEAAARIRELEAEVAALREARGVRVRVKALVWEAFGTMAFVAQAPLFGRLRVEQFGRGNTWTVCFSVPGYCDTFLSGEWADADAAKAAAQADYERRILAALEPAPVTVGEAAMVLLADEQEMLDLAITTMRNNRLINGKRIGYLPALTEALRALADAGEAGE